MTAEKIEEILRKAPGVAAPAGLRERLQGQIKLPQSEARQINPFDSRAWLRRWLPALSFAAFFIACLVAIGVQTSMISGLKRENETLRAAAEGIEQLRAEHEEFQRLQTQIQQLETLRQDNQDLQRLRTEVVQLRAQLPEVERLRTANERLRAENSAKLAKVSGENANNDFFAGAKEKAELTQCVNHLKQIGLAARMWANDHNEVYPSDFICMTNELSTFLILQCPSDKSRTVTNWSQVAAGDISYQMLAPGFTDPASIGFNTDASRIVFARCPIHGSVLLIDGSVQVGGTNRPNLEKHLKTIDGRLQMVP